MAWPSNKASSVVEDDDSNSYCRRKGYYSDRIYLDHLPQKEQQKIKQEIEEGYKPCKS